MKFAVICRYADKYTIKGMCAFFKVSRSGYYAFQKKQDKLEKDQALAQMIQACQQATNSTYGYRRVGIWLERKGIHANHKAVLRIMNKYGLPSQIRRRRKYRQMSDQLHRYPNLLNRSFSSARPNEKWVTDISYIPTPQGTLYLSIIRDLFDNSIVAYQTGTEQSVNLVLRTIQQVKKKKRSLQRCNSTVTKGFNTPHKHIFP